MRYTASEKEFLIEKNFNEYGSVYRFMDFIDKTEAANLTNLRAELIKRLEKCGVIYGVNNTKLDMRHLSPGCKICSEGKWSCLFINNICNAKCFYCPSEQKELSIPATNHLTFKSAEVYALYLKKFGFSGASISGGEPFITFDLTLEYIKTIREVMGVDFHIWMYTNGILADRTKIQSLANAGLNEIRFDLTAVDYNIEKAALACGIVETVTVEIPAIPDEIDNLKKMVSELSIAGINHLNLHQLRCTPYSVPKLIERGISFIHAPFVLAAYSEVTALELMAYTLENRINLPVNFCSFLYKHSCQNAASRKRGVNHIVLHEESVTESGYIRSITSKGLSLTEEEFKTNSYDSVNIDYFDSRITEKGGNGAKEISVTPSTKFFIHKRLAMPSFLLKKDEISIYKNPFLGNFLWDSEKDTGEMLNLSNDKTAKFAAIRNLEKLPSGFIEYF